MFNSTVNGYKKIFITGGARSGKSRFAQDTAEALGARRVFVATAQALDAEMAARIARHQAGVEVRIVTEDGELLRQLILDPTRDYQRQQRP